MTSGPTSDGAPGEAATASGGGQASPHPGPRSIRLPRRLAVQIADHARAEAPLEACGLIPGSASALDGGQPQHYEPCRNLAASPTRYEVHPEDYLRIYTALDRAGGEVWGIVHSHPTTPAVPSGLDVTMAAHPEALYLVVSLANTEPELRAWRIVRGARHEVALEIA